jgi:branched-chain amino acid transport system substrate-binding protein
MSSSKNEIPILLGSLLITGGVLAGGYWWFSNQNKPAANSGNNNNSSTPNNNTDANTSTGSPGTLSIGDKNIGGSEGRNSNDFLQAKNAGVAALGSKNYTLASTEFEKALKITPNAPETHIYANNAKIGDGKALTIGVAVPMKSDTPGALEMLRGVAQAQTEINKAGGINGIPLKVMIADDADEAKTAGNVAEAFGQEAQVLGVVGHFSSDSSLAAAEVYKKSQLVNISPVSSSVKLSGFSKYAFRTIPSDAVAAKALSEYALKNIQRKKAIVFYNSDSGYSKSLKTEFVTDMGLGGGTVVQEVDLHATDFNAATALNQATTLGADVIMMAANTSTLEKAMQVVDANNKKLPLLGGDDVYSPKTLELGKDKAVGLVVAVPWHIDGDLKAPFAASSRQFWKAEVNWRTALSYDAVQALAAALKINPTRAGVQTALSNPTFQTTGSSGNVKFQPSGDRNANIQLVKVVPGTKSKLGFDFVPVKK